MRLAKFNSSVCRNGPGFHKVPTPLPPRSGVAANETLDLTGAVEALWRRRRAVPQMPGKRRRGGVRPVRRYRWVELLRRVFSIDVLCSQCGGTRRLLAAINGGLRFRFLETQVTNQLVADIVQCGPRRRKPLRLSTLQTDANSSPVSR